MSTEGLGSISNSPIQKSTSNNEEKTEAQEVLNEAKDQVVHDQAPKEEEIEKVKNVVKQAFLTGGRVALTFHIPYQIVSFVGGALFNAVYSKLRTPDSQEAAKKMDEAAALETADAVKDAVAGSGVSNVPLGQDLATFLRVTSPDISVDQMNQHITKGDELLTRLKTIGTNKEEIPPELATPENVVHLMWALTKKTADKGELYISGAIRLQTKPLSHETFENFLRKCGENDNSSYPRISTHMKENILKGESQWGIDLKGMGLPAGKQTLLFAKQPDGTVYLKMEYHGCPPFWKKGYRTMANFMEFFGHSTDFISTRFNKSGSVKGIKYPKRKEHVPNDIKKEYLAVADTLFPPKKMSFFEKIFAKPSQEKEEFKQAASLGITAMKTKLGNVGSNDEEVQKLQAKLKEAELNVIGASAEQYTGDVKGNEVVLAL